jgi:hypothetical protein
MKTCADRIQGELAQRNALLRQVMDNPDHDDYFDDPALSLDRYKFLKVCFSYGGPSDYLEVIHNEGEINRAEYVFHDWYDGARTAVIEGSPMWEYAVHLVEAEQEYGDY